jgi:uncharacterized membrane protein
VQYLRCAPTELNGEAKMADASALSFTGFTLVIVGVLVIIAAIILIGISQGKGGKAKTAGIIIIGPVPIIFGSDKKTVKTLLAFAIVLTAIVIIAFLLYNFLR